MADEPLAGVEPVTEGQVVTTDFRTAGFLQARGVPFVGATRRDGHVVFTFAGDAAQLQQLVGTYPDSPEARYDTACRAMNGLLRGLGRTRRRAR